MYSQNLLLKCVVCFFKFTKGNITYGFFVNCVYMTGTLFLDINLKQELVQ